MQIKFFLSNNLSAKNKLYLQINYLLFDDLCVPLLYEIHK